MIRAIDYNDSCHRALGSLGGCHAAKTSADDHNTWEILGAFGSPGAAPWSAADLAIVSSCETSLGI